jgi:hypothetical protein
MVVREDALVPLANLPRHISSQTILYEEYQTVSTVVVGNGISGLVCALYIKITQPQHDVVVIDKGGSSNSKLSGQRYRTRLNGLCDPNLFCNSTNFPGADVLRLREFFSLGSGVIKDFTEGAAFKGLTECLQEQDRPEWFGPQLGKTTADGRGVGTSVLSWLRAALAVLGVVFKSGRVVELRIGGGSRIEGAFFVSSDGAAELLEADNWVIATGDPSGTLFHSTNAENEASLMGDLVAAGCKVRDAGIFMMHMAGNSDSDGRSKRGCLETDLLEHHDVYLQGEGGGFTVRHDEITDLLRQHKAHYHFKAICREIISHGGMAMYANANSVKYGRVMHHYSHIGLDTVDGVTITGLCNAYAIGDASAIGYWTGPGERLPGTALMHCLATARKCASLLVARRGSMAQVSILTASERITPKSTYEVDTLKDLNTEGLYAYVLGNRAGCLKWLGAISDLKMKIGNQPDRLLLVSHLMASACEQLVVSRAPVTPTLPKRLPPVR